MLDNFKQSGRAFLARGKRWGARGVVASVAAMQMTVAGPFAVGAAALAEKETLTSSHFVAGTEGSFPAVDGSTGTAPLHAPYTKDVLDGMMKHYQKTVGDAPFVIVPSETLYDLRQQQDEAAQAVKAKHAEAYCQTVNGDEVCSKQLTNLSLLMQSRQGPHSEKIQKEFNAAARALPGREANAEKFMGILDKRGIGELNELISIGGDGLAPHDYYVASIPPRAGFDRVQAVGLPNSDDFFKPTHEDKTRFDRSMLTPGLQEAMGPHVALAVRKYTIGHEFEHLNEDRSYAQSKDPFTISMASSGNEAKADVETLKAMTDLTGDTDFVKAIWADRTVGFIANFGYSHITSPSLYDLVKHYDDKALDLPPVSPEDLHKTLNKLWDAGSFRANDEERAHLTSLQDGPHEPLRDAVVKLRLSHLGRLIDGKDVSPEEREVLAEPTAQNVMQNAAAAWKYFDDIAKEHNLTPEVSPPSRWDGFVVHAGKNQPELQVAEAAAATVETDVQPTRPKGKGMTGPDKKLTL